MSEITLALIGLPCILLLWLWDNRAAPKRMQRPPARYRYTTAATQRVKAWQASDEDWDCS